jgi:hypothetical protein
MTKHWKRSRVTKAFADAGRAGSFCEAEARLDAVQLDIALGDDQISTPAGQAAALTAVATAHKCFGHVTLVAANDVPLISSLPLGETLLKAARRLGASISVRPRLHATHTIHIGTNRRGAGWQICCWWDRWLSGVRVFHDPIGDSRLSIAGVFAGALAVRHVFACVLAGRDVNARDATVSLWAPWDSAAPPQNGPERFDVPDKLWLLGLGHLGQAYVWNLCFLPPGVERLAVLQDDQSIGEENEATSLLVLPGTRHRGDVAITDDDPPYLLAGLDRLRPRLTLARHGFPFMLDAGIGHGHADFEGVQIRTIVGGQPLEGLWEKTGEVTSEKDTNRLLNRAAYVELEGHIGQCGTVSFAEASVAVPFVGAVTGALMIAQVIRLASLETAPLFLQMELGAPEFTTFGGHTAAPESNLGSFSFQL